MRSVGALTIAMPSTSFTPCWFVHVHAKSIVCVRLCLALAVTVAVSVSPTWQAPA